MQKEEIKFRSSTILEGMTSLRGLFAGREAKINDRPIERLLYDRERADKLAKELGYLRAMGAKYGFPLEETDASTLEEMALGTSHGGLLAICGNRTLPRLADSITSLFPCGFYVMMQGIEDPYNFGYALRSLYACGVDGVILSERNWFSAAGVVARSSAGASERLPVYVADPEEAADLIKARGYTLVCADERTDNILHTTPLKKPILLIVGGERRGISRALLERADLRVKIAYARPFAASLSAASAATILGYEIFRQNQE